MKSRYKIKCQINNSIYQLSQLITLCRHFKKKLMCRLLVDRVSELTPYSLSEGWPHKACKENSIFFSAKVVGYTNELSAKKLLTLNKYLS